MKKKFLFTVCIGMLFLMNEAVEAQQLSSVKDSSYITIPVFFTGNGGMMRFMCMDCKSYFADWNKYSLDVRLSEDSLRMDDPNMPIIHPDLPTLIPGEDGGQVLHFISDEWSKYKVLFVQVSIKENATNTVKVASSIVRVKEKGKS